MLLRAVTVVAMAIALCGQAQAQRRGVGGSLKLSARGGAEVDPPGDDRIVAGSWLVDLRGMFGRRVGVAAEVGFEIGAEVPGGFAYALRLQPLGAAVRFGSRGWIGAIAGIGGSGVIDRVPIGLELPVTAFAAVDVGRWIRVSSQLRAAWIPTTSRREGGSRALDIVDELDFEAGVAIGKRESQWQSVYSDGTYVGVFVREQVDQRVVGISIAIAISGAGSF